MEHITDRVDVITRSEEFFSVLETCTLPNTFNHDGMPIVDKTTPADVTPLMAFVADLVEQAFIAGRESWKHGIECRCTPEDQHVGVGLTAARNYVKDKGLRL